MGIFEQRNLAKPSGWSDGAPPLPIQNVIIENNNNPTKVTFDTTASISGLTIYAGAILNIVGGSLTVTQTIANSGEIEINSSGVDPTFAITGNISLQDGGDFWLRPPRPRTQPPTRSSLWAHRRSPTSTTRFSAVALLERRRRADPDQ